MALTYTVRDKKTLVADGGTDTSQGMAMVRADITLAASTDYGSVTTGTGTNAPGVPLVASSLGFGSTGAILGILDATFRGSTTDSIPKFVTPLYDAAKSSVRAFVLSATNASAFTEILQSQFTAGDILRVTLLGQVGN